MPSGTGSRVLATLPDVPYVIDPASFAASTEKQEQWITPMADPGAGQSGSINLSKSGILSSIKITFVGKVVVTTAGTQPTPGARWPYGLINRFQLGSGLGNNPWDTDGLALDALHAADHPFVTNGVDQFPGVVGGGGSALVAGTYPLSLTWDVPIAVDQVSLVASMYLQSSSNLVQATITRESEANLFTGTTADATISGNFNFELRRWKIPVDSQGRLVVPDISHVHVFNKVPQPLLGTGEQPASVLRTAGVLQRLFVRAELSPTNMLSALPSTATTNLIDRIALNYGLTETPMDYNPASVLAQLNQDWYGAPLPYDHLCFDTLRENALRDAILLQGVTDLQVQLYPDSGVTVPVGAKTNLYEEILV
ncbi:MAG TPA: hypothetical protein VFN61_04495 [Acidimicrobiales bacterium]|nr:hypothetical protein [Acidimicrobiales bacterium]